MHLWYLPIKKNKRNLPEPDWGWGSRLTQIHCHWIFGGVPNRILVFPYRKSYFNKGYTEKRKENQKRKLVCQGKEPEAGRKHFENENLPFNQILCLLTWKTQYFQRRRVLDFATKEEMSAALGKVGVTLIRKITIRKGERLKPTPTSWQSTNLTFSRK